MERFDVVIAKDGMQAEVALRPGPELSTTELTEALAAAGVVHGINTDAITRLCAATTETRATVAHGTVASVGQDEELVSEEWHTKLPGRPFPDGGIDYRDRHFLHAINQSDVLGTINARTVGDDGRDVRGRKLPGVAGQPLRQHIGDGAQRRGNSIIARRAGVAVVNEELIDVAPLYTHSGNVDYASGNLRTAGSLLIEGDVDVGFQAEADGDIAVMGTVQGQLHAKGSLMIERGIMGKQVVRAGADLTCQHATNATLRAGSNLVVADQAAQCSLHAQNVLVIDGRATVRGGQICARDRILVGSAGAVAGTPTLLAVGQLLDERAELARRNAKTYRESRRTKRSPDRGQASKSQRSAVKAHDDALAEKLRLKRRQRELLREATIQITNTCFCGVTIEFGQFHLQVDRDLRDVTFRFDLETDTIQYSTQENPA
ncbi:MAG: hypothetical protein ACI89X_003855 [Planctomycetota bacterium]|jgi:uncharacterized protein (DUF342 family)